MDGRRDGCLNQHSDRKIWDVLLRAATGNEKNGGPPDQSASTNKACPSVTIKHTINYHTRNFVVISMLAIGQLHCKAKFYSVP